MSVGAKLAAFAAILAGSFGVGAVVGAAIGPIDVGGDSPAEHAPDHGDDAPATTQSMNHSEHTEP